MLPTGCVNRVLNCRPRVQIRDTLLLTCIFTNILKFNFPVFSPLHFKRNKTYLNTESHDFHFDVTPITLYFRNDVKTCNYAVNIDFGSFISRGCVVYQEKVSIFTIFLWNSLRVPGRTGRDRDDPLEFLSWDDISQRYCIKVKI